MTVASETRWYAAPAWIEGSRDSMADGVVGPVVPLDGFGVLVESGSGVKSTVRSLGQVPR
jgi:hypothetical protein